MNIWSGTIALNGETQLEGDTPGAPESNEGQQLTQVSYRPPPNRPDLAVAIGHSQRLDAPLPLLRQSGASPAVRARWTEPGTAHDGEFDGGMAKEQTGGECMVRRGGSRAVSVGAVSGWDLGGC